MTLEGLPKEIVEGCCPILVKYGVVEQNVQGHILKNMGGVFKDIAKAITDDKRKLKHMSFFLLNKTRKVLFDGGIRDPIKRDNCAKDLIEFLLEVFKEEVKKHG